MSFVLPREQTQKRENRRLVPGTFSIEGVLAAGGLGMRVNRSGAPVGALRITIAKWRVVPMKEST
jgi:hypothetical protein